MNNNKIHTFLKNDLIHIKGTKSWFLNPPKSVAKITPKGYIVEYQTMADSRHFISFADARKYEVVARIINGKWCRL